MALTTELKRNYMNTENKFILPDDAGENNRDLAATVAANFASVTYRMSNEDIEALLHASREDIIRFYQEYFPILQERIGADHEYHPFYPNFPEEVMERDDIDFFFDQLIYGLTGFEVKPEVYEEAQTRFPYMGYTASHPIYAGSERDYIDSIEKIIKSSAAYTPLQRKYIISFLKEYDGAQLYIPKADLIKNHENRVVLACTMRDMGIESRYILPLLSDANDIIKYATIRAAQEDYNKNRGDILENINRHFMGTTYEKEDFYRYASLRIDKTPVWGHKPTAPSYKFPRSERNFIIKAVEACAVKYGVHSLEQAMMNNKKEWKSLIKNIHIGDYPQAERTQKAFADISTNTPVNRVSRTIEEAIKVNDLRAALDASVKMPGDFIRRVDKFLQMGLKKGDISPVIDALKSAASKASFATLSSLAAHIQKRTEPKEKRIFNIAASNKRFTKPDTRETFSPMITELVKNTCIEGIKEQMKGKDIFTKEDAKVYISPKTSDYKMPSETRGLSEGSHTYTVGSKIDVGTPSDYRRLFVWWTNTEHSRVDIDLSVNMYDAKGQLVQRCGWNTNYHVENESPEDTYAFCFSGDVQDGGNINGKGAAEFIDINPDVLKKMGVRYIVPSVNSYCSQPFYAMQNIAFGYMDRDSIEPLSRYGMSGQLFEPSTVETKFDLNFNGTSCIPCIFDIGEEREEIGGNEGSTMVWVDSAYQGRVMSRDDNYIDQIMSYIGDKALMDIAELVEVNAKANGAQVFEDPTQADYLFITVKEFEELKEQYPDVDWSEKEIISPDNLNYIMGTLMATAEVLPAKEIDKTKTEIDIDEVIENIDDKDIETERNSSRGKAFSNMFSHDDDNEEH